MGANNSAVEDAKSSSPTSNVSRAVFSSTYNNTNYEQGRVVSISDDKTRQYNNVSNPAAALLPSGSRTANAKRVMYFRSSPSFRGYLEASKASNTLIVIDFVNGWCGRCRYMEPTLHEFAAKYTNVEFVKIDIDELFDISRHYGVQTTPTFMLMKKGRVIDRVDGANKEELQRKIEKYNIV